MQYYHIHRGTYSVPLLPNTSGSAELIVSFPFVPLRYRVMRTRGLLVRSDQLYRREKN